MDVGDLVGSRTPEGAGIDSGRDSVGGCCWFREMDGKPDARGSRHRSEQGLRRGILLGLREPAKTIASGPELAVGSNS